MAVQTRTEEEITTGLMAMVRWAGQQTAAARELKREHGLSVTPGTLKAWTERHAEKYESLRERFAEQLESENIDMFRQLTQKALEAQSVAIDKAKARLKAGDDNDPGRTAANLAAVAKANNDNMLKLSGRPTVIREDRNAEEILRNLMSRHPQIFQIAEADVVDERPELPSSEPDG